MRLGFHGLMTALGTKLRSMRSVSRLACFQTWLGVLPIPVSGLWAVQTAAKGIMAGEANPPAMTMP
jgi:hypothetical protein